MSSYADVAVKAAGKLSNGQLTSAREAWDSAALEVFSESPSMQSKNCPRTIFLTLCAVGAIKGIPAVGLVKDSANARHAKDCLAFLAKHPDYISMQPRQLWRLITHASGKNYNQQMHVILGLANGELLQFDAQENY